MSELSEQEAVAAYGIPVIGVTPTTFTEYIEAETRVVMALLVYGNVLIRRKYNET